MERGRSADRDRDGAKGKLTTKLIKSSVTRYLTLIYCQMVQIADDDYMTQIMFDYPDTRRSRYYFRVLQFLRVMDESVVEMRQYLESWGASLRLYLRGLLDKRNGYCSSSELDSIFEQWEVMKNEWEEGMDKVRQRIARKQTEVQSLRDGVRCVNLARLFLLKLPAAYRDFGS